LTVNDCELKRERRRQRALERLGSNKPRCIFCGCDEPLALELHHIAGRAFDGEVVVVCRNCHRRLSDPQKDHPVKQNDPPNDLEQIAHFLEGLADLFEMLVKRLRQFAATLIGHVRGDPADGETQR
jgi:hypothetical protein